MSCPASPAPITSTVFSARSPGPSRASSTAIDETDTGRRPIVVRSRTFRPTRIAVWNSRDSAGLCVSACVAAVKAPRTCPRISVSPTTIESMPAATRNRCRAASSPLTAVNGTPSIGISPLSSLSSATIGRGSSTARASVTYTSVRLHVESTAAPA